MKLNLGNYRLLFSENSVRIPKWQSFKKNSISTKILSFRARKPVQKLTVDDLRRPWHCIVPGELPDLASM